MSSIKELVEEFEQERDEQPLLGDWIIFNDVVEEQGLSQEEIREFFNIVRPEGYDVEEEGALLRSSRKITKRRTRHPL